MEHPSILSANHVWTPYLSFVCAGCKESPLYSESCGTCWSSMAPWRRWHNIKHLHRVPVFVVPLCESLSLSESGRTVLVRKLNPTIFAPHAVYIVRVASSYSMRSLSCQCWMVLWQAAWFSQFGRALITDRKELWDKE
jgi:hypothetical protein